MALSVKQQRRRVRQDVEQLNAMTDTLRAPIARWLETFDDIHASAAASDELAARFKAGRAFGPSRCPAPQHFEPARSAGQKDHLDVRRRRMGVRHRFTAAWITSWPW